MSAAAKVSPLRPIIRHENIPAELRALPQWVCWRFEPDPKGGKPRKKPITPGTYRGASHSDATTWGAFQVAKDWYEANASRLDGIGFVFTEGDPFAGIDLDGCFVNGKLTPEAQEIVRRFNSYTERSVSGDGLHIIVRCNQNFPGKKGGGIEAYTSKRFFVFTGRTSGQAYRTIQDRKQVLLDFCAEHFPKEKQKTAEPPKEELPARGGEYGKAALLAELAELRRANVGERNHALNKTCFALGQLVAGGELALADVEYEVSATAREIGLDEAEIAATMGSGVKAGMKEPRRRPDGPAPMTFAKQPGDAPGRGFRFLSLDEMLAEPRPPRWLIQDYLEESSLACLFGASGAMKSFVALDMGLCLATGTPWHGQFVGEPGPVFYICGEGFGGIAKRVKAWFQEHSINPAGVPFFVSSSAVEILDADSLQKAFVSLDKLAEAHGAPRLVIVDTLARNFGPGDENSTRDMSSFVAALDRVRERFSCTVLTVHHTGLAAQERGRGSYALHAGVDFEFRLEVRDNTRVLSCTKAKDHEEPKSVAFEPAVLDVGWKDATGEPVTSVVLRRVGVARQGVATKSLSLGQQVALDSLSDLAERSQDGHVLISDWRQEAYRRGVTPSEEQEAKKKAFQRAVKDLQKSGLIETDSGYYWPTHQTGQTGPSRDMSRFVPGRDGTHPFRGVPVVPTSPPGQDWTAPEYRPAVEGENHG